MTADLFNWKMTIVLNGIVQKNLIRVNNTWDLRLSYEILCSIQIVYLKIGRYTRLSHCLVLSFSIFDQK